MQQDGRFLDLVSYALDAYAFSVNSNALKCIKSLQSEGFFCSSLTSVVPEHTPLKTMWINLLLDTTNVQHFGTKQCASLG